ncbi:MAG TPA: extracellular solute-binding protein [Candidatus Binatia bacterium]|nr:extracellular solute-binding protein [Candidatus Binatia bacterium]
MKQNSFIYRKGRGLILTVSKSLIGFLMFVGSAHPAGVKPSWEVTWENTVAAAKKEGRLNFYVGRYGSEKLLNEFRKEFPEIKIVGTHGSGNSLGTRIVSEARAGQVLADLYSGGAVTNFEILYKGKTLDSLKSALLLPEVLDESKWYGGKHRYNDLEQQHVFIYIANPTSTSIYFNTQLVNPKDFKSFWDLVNPRWKGKFVSQEPTSTGIGPSLQFFFYHPELGPDFLRKLFIDQQPIYSRDRRQMTDWLAQGKFALCLGCRDAERANKQGLPVDDMDMVDWKEGSHISSGGGSLGLIKGGPHPNAAKVFINWFLSRRGQMALQKYEDLYDEDPPNSRRIDIPKDMLPPSSRLVEGRRYFDFSEPKYSDMTPIYQLAKEFMKGREAK